MPPPAAPDDPPGPFRTAFDLPPGKIYLDGNSLGPLCHPAEASLRRVIDDWRHLAIEGWTEAAPPWIDLAERIAVQLAPLVGASPGEIAVTGSTTLNLHQLVATLYDPADPRPGILADELNFSSDLHALHSQLALRGRDPGRTLHLVRSRDGRTLTEEDILAALTPGIQLAVLPVVQYVSGQLLDTAAITREARARGIAIGWDCSHSIGAVPHALADEGADFAFWCSYKYLNAGPGAVGGLFLHRRHHGRAPGLAGWWGVDPARRFALRGQHEPAPDARAAQIATPHLFSLAPLEGALTLFADAGGIVPLRERSLRLTSLLMEEIDRKLAGLGFSIVTPREPARRGGHIALAHPEAWRLTCALRAEGVIPDFRPPDVIRLAPAALYTTAAECIEAIDRLRRIVLAGTWATLSSGKPLVT